MALNDSNGPSAPRPSIAPRPPRYPVHWIFVALLACLCLLAVNAVRLSASGALEGMPKLKDWAADDAEEAAALPIDEPAGSPALEPELGHEELVQEDEELSYGVAVERFVLDGDDPDAQLPEGAVVQMHEMVVEPFVNRAELELEEAREL
ncbi:hypothetical protein M427DRAFT_137893 [Gonapodya prolifera JEL478]|uniref:Uncharacterized protein n=1 Tax=Gonapodya prolifera (strain JEL478) TaxID=1344416 RepID=A0A139A602_GONPJ|nr:hypothetical protein M427DRAFT_137893 [Gonapodya prolifera JEL478]|eukprot:KXS11813.1 hypothetical protein M427DRAFT_137893 [Gonapodya prolifera JEL478]